MRKTLIALTVLAIGLVPTVFVLAEDASFTATAKELGWNEPVEPMTVVGPIHFVGTRGLIAWLITTTGGHILLNTGLPPSGPLIEASIKELGFKPEDVKLLITCHAHVDHVCGLAYLERVTGAQVVSWVEAQHQKFDAALAKEGELKQ